MTSDALAGVLAGLKASPSLLLQLQRFINFSFIKDRLLIVLRGDHDASWTSGLDHGLGCCFLGMDDFGDANVVDDNSSKNGIADRTGRSDDVGDDVDRDEMDGVRWLDDHQMTLTRAKLIVVSGDGCLHSEQIWSLAMSRDGDGEITRFDVDE